MATRRFDRALVIALVAIFLAKLVVLLQLTGHPLLQPDEGLDSGYYVALARRVLDGDLLLGPGLYFISPLYLYFLAIVFGIGDGSLLVAKLAQIVLGTAACGLVFATARRWFGQRAAWIALALAALTGEFTFYEVTILQAALDPFLTALDIYLLSRAVQDDRHGWSIAAGVVLAIHTLNRPNMLIVAGGLVVLFAIPARAHWRWTKAVALASGIAIGLAPLSARNIREAGTILPTPSHGGLNLYIGNNPDADGTYRMVEGITPNIAGQAEDAKRVAERARGRSLTDAEVSSYFTRRALDWMAGHPGDAGRLFVRKLAYTLNAGSIALNYSFPFYQDDEATLLGVLRVGPLVLVPAGIVGLLVFVLTRTRAPDGFWRVAAFVPLSVLSVAVFFVASRYRLSLLVPLAVTSAATFDLLWQALSSRDWKRAVTVAAVAAPLVALAGWNMRLDDGRREERTQMALALIDEGRFDDARRWIALAQQDHPDPALLHVRLAQAYRERGRLPDAVAQYEAALSSGVHVAQVEGALGETLLDAGRPADAIPHLRRATAVAAEAKDVVAYDLARAYVAIGDRRSASAAIAAIRADPRRDADSSLELARLALTLEQPSIAEQHLRAAMARDNSRPEPYEQLGFVLMQQGRLPEAAGALERGATLAPASASVRLNLAVVYAQQGRYADAETQARAALAIDPEYDRAKAFLGELQRRVR